VTPKIAVTGVVDKPSNHSVEQTVDRLKDILESKGVKLFALVDHSGEAEKAGMKMPPTKLLIFGDPKAGTPLMLAVPIVAIDLPLKILVWERDGFVLWYKRLEAGVFKLPRVEQGARSVEIRASELAMILDGIDVSKLKRVPRYNRAVRSSE